MNQEATVKHLGARLRAQYKFGLCQRFTNKTNLAWAFWNLKHFRKLEKLLKNKEFWEGELKVERKGGKSWVEDFWNTTVLLCFWLWCPGCRWRGRPAACVDGEPLSCCLPGMTQRVRNACMCPGDWWWGGRHLVFLMLVNAQKMKMKSIFHKWGTKWFKTRVIMTYLRVKNQFLLQQGSVHLRQGRGGEEACELSISEKQKRAEGSPAKEAE